MLFIKVKKQKLIRHKEEKAAKSDIHGKILKKIAIEGNQFQKDLETNLEKGRTRSSGNIGDAIKKLKRDGLIHPANKPSNVEKEKKGERITARTYFGITEDGILYLIEHHLLNIEEFWKMLFNCFNRDLQFVVEIKNENQWINPQFDIKKIILEFEKTNLHLSREYIFPQNFKIHFQNFKNLAIFEDWFSQSVEDHGDGTDNNLLNKKQVICSLYEILGILAQNGKLNRNELYSKLKRHKWKKYQNILEQASEQGLVIVWQNKQETIGLSPIGLLLFIYNDFEEFRRKNLTRNGIEFQKQIRKMKRKTEKIIITHELLFPHIFKKWKELTRIGIFELLVLFRYFFYENYDVEYWFPEHAEEEMNLLISQSAMESIFSLRLKKEHLEGIEFCNKWRRQNNCDLPFGDSDYTIFGDSFQKEFYLTGRTPKQRIQVKFDSNLEFNVVDLDINKDKPKGIQKFNSYFKKSVVSLIDGGSTNRVENEFREHSEQFLKQNGVVDVSTMLNAVEKVFNDTIKIIKIKRPLKELIELEKIVRPGGTIFDQKLNFENEKEFKNDYVIIALQNVFSFRFYSYLRAHFPETWNKIMKEEMKKNKINLYSWYQEWLDLIKSFSKTLQENQNQIKALKELSVE